MPRYEFRCRACGDTFEVERPMSSASEPAACPAGHPDTVKLLDDRARQRRRIVRRAVVRWWWWWLLRWRLLRLTTSP